MRNSMVKVRLSPAIVRRAKLLADRGRMIEQLKELCLSQLRMSTLTDKEHQGSPSAAIAAAMLEVAGPSVVAGDTSNSVRGGHQNVEIRAQHALDLLARIEAIQWLPRTPIPRSRSSSSMITGAVPNTKKVLWKAIWLGCSSDDPSAARRFSHALLATRIFWEEEERAFGSAQVARYYFRHDGLLFREIIRTAPAEGSATALSCMIAGSFRRSASSYEQMRSMFL